METDAGKMESLRGELYRIWEEMIVGTVVEPFLGC